MRITTGIVFFLFPFIIYAQNNAQYVNPFIGAINGAGKAGIYHGLGKTFPGATTPFGAVQVSPNTITGGDNGSGYSYEDSTIEGFAFTQMSGVGWFGDLGNFLVMPGTGNIKTWSGKPGDAKAGYRSHYANQQAGAGYYAVQLTDYNIKAEMTAAPHSGMMRFTFPANRQSHISIDLARRVGGTSTEQYVHVVNENTIEGWMKCTPDGGGWGNGDGRANYTVYFYAQFNKPLKDYGTWSASIPDTASRKREAIESDYYQQRIADAKIEKMAEKVQGKHLGFFSSFETKAGEQVLLKCGISFVSVEGARNNLQTELKHWDFDAAKAHAFNSWNRALSKINIKGGTKDERTVFYTALYHTMIDPRNVTDADGYYTGADQQKHRATTFQKRTIFSGWDVFRSQFPLQTLINPAVVNDMIASLVTMADESGNQYLERWELLNAYSGCMLGNPAVVVLADAYGKGINSYDKEKAYRYAVNTCGKFGNGDKGFSSAVSIANTLEYAFADWCLYKLAKETGHYADTLKYLQRSQAYKNIYDSTHHWFRPKKEDGSWEQWPATGRLTDWYGTFETNPYQQGWFVPHDINGMVDMMGGRQAVLSDLDSFFAHTPHDFSWNAYYNHANEPVHHVPYLYNALGQPWKTQYWTRTICSNAYKNDVDGLVGNEDVGQMSAWYVLSAAGLHPLNPAATTYEITSPAFEKIVIALDRHYAKAGSFTVAAKNNSSRNIYIQSATLNGKVYNKSSIDYQDILNGGKLELVMGPQPSLTWGLER
ncbi:GH92 family glycosyl hydrolase [Panacibacter sp. DH6]|uniref:GH92 family glycosyl hydrolase n=1 Tax=Panacibacter microcysteis TaxID=2793269 RepID=A0A931H009_9BACT|nr:GH92 family glycosyl hydrolase [Panacibacter microcysteis]MBG9378510.1 GH92 family glycosyl hydrolase [Panacibacter microcysteis]